MRDNDMLRVLNEMYNKRPEDSLRVRHILKGLALTGICYALLVIAFCI